MPEIVIQPQEGPQTKAAMCPADIIVYGGAAGGGKSWFQAYRASRYHRTKGYDAILFRRTFAMLRGGGSLQDECEDLYALLGATGTKKPPEWIWPQYGSRVELSHLQHEKNALDHKSKQYAYVGMDEGSDYTGRQFEILRSRMRTLCGVPTQLVNTTNPDPDCYLREWIDWWIGSDGYPMPERDGVLRYFLRIRGEIVWSNDRAALEKYATDPRDVQSFTFIAAKLADNKILMQKDPSYIGKLRALPPVDQARFLGGNWDVRESAGDYYQRGWFTEYGASELERILLGQIGEEWQIVQAIRFWDRAGTPVKGDLVPAVTRPADFAAREASARSKDPDWTFGVLLVRFRNGHRAIMDTKYYRDTPGAIEAAMIRQAEEDGPGVTVGYWQDPAQAGIDQAERMAQALRKYANVWYTVQHKTKQEYAREPSRAAYRGEILKLGSADLRMFWNQMEAFPDKTKKDDGPDAFAGAELYMSENPVPTFGYENLKDVRVATAREIQLFAPELDDDRRATDMGDNHVPATSGFGRNTL